MNRHDRRAWRSVQTWDDLGAMTVAWLHGTVEQTPAHMGPPDPETIPLIPALTAANQAGFVTTNSQCGDGDGTHSWEAWVCGLIPAHLFPVLRDALAGTELEVRICRKGHHECMHGRGILCRIAGALALLFGWGCAWTSDAGCYGTQCPKLGGEIRTSWGVTIRDPEPGRNAQLWPALERFASLTPARSTP